MNPFELTKDPDGGGITVRVKYDFVVLTREEERRVTERITEILAENTKLRELASILCFCMQVHSQCDDCKLNGAKGEMAHDPLLACDGLHEMLRELGIEDE